MSVHLNEDTVIVIPSAGVKRAPVEPAPPVDEVLDMLRAEHNDGSAPRWRLVALALQAGGCWSLISDATGLPALDVCDGFRRYLRNLTEWLDCWPGRAFDGFTHDAVIELYRLARGAEL